MGAGKHGGFGNTSGKTKAPEIPNTDGSVSLPKEKAQLKHIFGDREGHLTDTPYHRKQLKNLANDKSYYKGKDKYGNSWNVKIMRDGSQLWARHRNGTINEGGKNKTPRPWDKQTGLNRNPKKRKNKEGGKK